MASQMRCSRAAMKMSLLLLGTMMCAKLVHASGGLGHEYHYRYKKGDLLLCTREPGTAAYFLAEVVQTGVDVEEAGEVFFQQDIQNTMKIKDLSNSSVFLHRLDKYPCEWTVGDTQDTMFVLPFPSQPQLLKQGNVKDSASELGMPIPEDDDIVPSQPQPSDSPSFAGGADGEKSPTFPMIFPGEEGFWKAPFENGDWETGERVKVVIGFDVEGRLENYGTIKESKGFDCWTLGPKVLQVQMDRLEDSDIIESGVFQIFPPSTPITLTREGVDENGEPRWIFEDTFSSPPEAYKKPVQVFVGQPPKSAGYRGIRRQTQAMGMH